MEIKQESVDLKIDAIGEGLVLLPRNIYDTSRDSAKYNTTTLPVLKTLKANGVEVKLYDVKDVIYQEDRSNEWYGPIIFVSSLVLTQDPNCISVALGIVANYLTDFFKGSTFPGKAKLTIIRENPDKTKTKIQYEGPASGLKDLAEIVKQSK